MKRHRVHLISYEVNPKLVFDGSNVFGCGRDAFENKKSTDCKKSVEKIAQKNNFLKISQPQIMRAFLL